MRNKQGQYLKEISIGFSTNKEIKQRDAEDFLHSLIYRLKVKLTALIVNDLPPGFDILCGIKESCIYFGYWGEDKYVRLYIASCKNFDHTPILNIIGQYFKVKDMDFKIITDSEVRKCLIVCEC